MSGHGELENEALSYALSLAERLFCTLAEQTADPPGVTRASYGSGERPAFEIIAGAAREWNAEVDFDSAGNQFITLPGVDRSRAIYIGSHLDSVAHGGNHDGTVGVVMGIAAQSILASDYDSPFCDITVACLRAEESCRFPHSYIGSKATLGLLDPSVLDSVRRSDTGRTLAEHMRDEGFDPQSVWHRRCFIHPGRAVAYLEPHIEQGPVLVSEGLPIGIVSGTRGSIRYRDARCVGEYAHSGATPRWLRCDAAPAAAAFVTAAQELWCALEQDGHDLVLTFGILQTDSAQHSFSKVPGLVHLCLDVRSQSASTLRLLERRITDLAARTASQDGVQFDLGAVSGSEPALMSPHVTSICEAACHKVGVTPYRMASGAGHDAATFAHAGIHSGMIFIRNENGSHNPHESIQMKDFEVGLRVLVTALREPAERWLRKLN